MIPETETRPAAPPRLFVVVVLVACGAAVLLGAVLRAWMLTHLPVTGDEATVGLMADQIRHGHLYTFYWGQSYGGAEPYLVAALTGVFGTTAITVNLTASLLAAVSSLVVWRIVARLVTKTSAWIAVVAAAVFWVWPVAAVWNSTRELGFRSVTMLAGLSAILLALRVVAGWRNLDVAALGLALGVGWWSSPEIVYFAVPALGIVGESLLLRRSHAPVRPILLAGGGFVIGALPWIWTNLHSSFASIKPGSSPSYVHSSYLGRVGIFFKQTFPMMLGLKLPLSGAWVAGSLGRASYVLAAVVLVALCVVVVFGGWRSERLAATKWCAVSVLLFPFIFAAFPAVSYWEEGHYGVFLVPLLILTVFGTLGSGAAARRRRSASGEGRAARPLISVVCVALAVAVSVVGFNDTWLRASHRSFLAGWHGPNTVAEQAAAALRRQGVKVGYSDYWTAYDLDLLSHNHLEITDVFTDRWVSLYRLVRSAPNQAWISTHLSTWPRRPPPSLRRRRVPTGTRRRCS